MNTQAQAWLVLLLVAGCKLLDGSEYPDLRSNQGGYPAAPVNCEGKDPRFIAVECNSLGTQCSCMDRLPSKADEGDYCRAYRVVIHKVVSDGCRQQEETQCAAPTVVDLFRCEQDCLFFPKCAEP